MGKLFYPDFFNDVFGPIMQPGSSGAFAGTCRLGRIARHSLASEPARADIRFNPSEHRMKGLGNFMEDRAYLGGLQDFDTDDERLFDAHGLARRAGISYSFGELSADGPHARATTFFLTGRDGDTATFVGTSIGGGMVRTQVIDGFPVQWQGDTHAVLAWGDAVGDAALQVISRAGGGQLVEARRVRDDAGYAGLFAELSREPDCETLGEGLGALGLEWRAFPALLPVVTSTARRPQLFDGMGTWRRLARERGCGLVQVAIDYEKAFSGWSDEQVWDRLELVAQTLLRQIHALEDLGYDRARDTPNLPIYGKQWHAFQAQGRSLQDPLTQRILDYAFSTNAKLPGVKIVPGPMGTGGGYLMSALEAVREARGFTHAQLLEGLAVAAGLGAVAFTRTHPTGEAGCAGESGVCCAMASGAIAQMAGGTPEQVESAASMALQANIGLVCDPIPGGREFPCLTRTLRAATSAPLYADLALAGIDPVVPYDEALDAIEAHYRATPPARLCGPDCGMNRAPAAQACQRFLVADLMEGKMSFEAGR